MEILFEDQHLIVINKPAGLLSQGESTGDPNLVDLLRERFGRPYVGLVHRLDRNTSGLMVVAKRTKAANRLTEALQSGELKRSYLAWVMGRISGPARWRHFLVKDERTNVVRAFKQNRPGAKEATLTATPRSYSNVGTQELTLLELVLETGRSHQIRAQAQAEGHPLVGDKKYGGISLGGIDRPALHSAHLEFPHPMSKEILSFESELPNDLRFGNSTIL